ncbi:MAG: 5'/3'-nucleotidase SurE [Polyangiales bacterium]
MPSPRRAPPVILVTNDDGYHAPGIRALARALDALGDVFVVAPESEQSSTSHALTLSRPLRLRAQSPGVWSLDGTPADCTYVALHHKGLLPRPPAVVVSGINMGLNLGTDVFYSGTVAGAREAALRGVPAAAFSMPSQADARRCAARARTMVARLLAWRATNPKAAAPLLNVNFPDGPARGVRLCTLGTREYENLVEERRDPRGRQYLWIGGPSVAHRPNPGSDTEAHDQGYVSVTSLRLDLSLPEVHEAAKALAGRR